jgi:hypothetical protein
MTNLFCLLICIMVYIQETDEYLEFLKSDEIKFNRFINIKKFYTIIKCSD